MAQKIKNFLYRMLCGFFLGVSVIAPGVSGSVMAVMMGIYPDLINIISSPFRRFKRNFMYLLPMGIGAIISLAIFVKLFDFLFTAYPIQARILFMGLIAGGLPEIIKNARRVPFKKHYLIGIAGAFVAAAGVGLLARGGGSAMADPALFYICLAGGVAGACSMAPGMSVSMILMLFGVYDYLMKIASSFTSDLLGMLAVALPVGGCFIVGMVLFSKLSKFVFEKFPGLAYYMVFGFMCGTLTAVAPDSLPASVGGIAGCVLMFALGLCVALLFVFLGRKFNSEEEPSPE